MRSKYMIMEEKMCILTYQNMQLQRTDNRLWKLNINNLKNTLGFNKWINLSLDLKWNWLVGLILNTYKMFKEHLRVQEQSNFFLKYLLYLFSSQINLSYWVSISWCKLLFCRGTFCVFRISHFQQRWRHALSVPIINKTYDKNVKSIYDTGCLSPKTKSFKQKTNLEYLVDPCSILRSRFRRSQLIKFFEDGWT